MFVLTLYIRYFSRYLGTYRHTHRKTYIQKVSFYNIDVRIYEQRKVEVKESFPDFIIIKGKTAEAEQFLRYGSKLN